MQTVISIDKANVDTINNVALQNFRRVVAWSTPVVVVCLTAGATLIATHDLGVKPNLDRDRLFVQPWQDARWWVGLPDRALWSDKSIAFSASAPGRYTVSVGRM